jgi:hypothetical protein
LSSIGVGGSLSDFGRRINTGGWSSSVLDCAEGLAGELAALGAWLWAEPLVEFWAHGAGENLHNIRQTTTTRSLRMKILQELED